MSGNVKNPCGLRVITRFGLGIVLGLSEIPSEGRVRIHLDKETKTGEKEMMIETSGVYPETDCLLIRLAHLPMGWVSSLMFLTSSAFGRWLLHQKAPDDEVQIVLDLVNGSFVSNRPLSFLMKKLFMLEPWLDRWHHEIIDTDSFDRRDSVLVDTFRNRQAKMAGTTGGISSSFLLELDPDGFRGKIHSYYIVSEVGTGIIMGCDYPHKEIVNT